MQTTFATSRYRKKSRRERWEWSVEEQREEESEIGSQRAKCIGRPNVICDTGRLPACLFPRFFAGSFRLSCAAKLDISCAIKSNLLRKRPVPSARVISMASTLDRSVGERANNTADFKRFYVNTRRWTLFPALPLPLSFFRSLLILEIENNVNIRMRDSSWNFTSLTCSGISIWDL